MQSMRRMNRVNLPQLSGFRFQCMKEIPSVLQRQPVPRRIPEKRSQSQSSARRDPSPPVDQLIDSLIWHMNFIREISL